MTHWQSRAWDAEVERDRYRAERDRYREALERIASMRLIEHAVNIARAALDQENET